MQRIFAVIGLQRISLAVKRELASSYAVSVSAYKRAVICPGFIDIIFGLFVSHNHVAHVAVFIGSGKAYYSRAVRQNVQLASVFVGDAVNFVDFSVSFEFFDFFYHCSSPYFLFNSRIVAYFDTFVNVQKDRFA